MKVADIILPVFCYFWFFKRSDLLCFLGQRWGRGKEKGIKRKRLHSTYLGFCHFFLLLDLLHRFFIMFHEDSNNHLHFFSFSFFSFSFFSFPPSSSFIFAFSLTSYFFPPVPGLALFFSLFLPPPSDTYSNHHFCIPLFLVSMSVSRPV